MNQDRAHRAFARGLFVFVGPAPVISKSLALEKLCVVRGRLIHQHQQDFAFDVCSFVIIPAIFRRLDSITDVDDFGIDVRLGLLGLIVGHVLVERFQVVRSTFDRNKRKRGRRLRRDAHHRNFLHIGSVVACRLQPVKRELCGDVLSRNVSTPLTGATPFEQIVRKKTDVGANPLRIDFLKRGNRCRREVRGSSGRRSHRLA